MMKLKRKEKKEKIGTQKKENEEMNTLRFLRKGKYDIEYGTVIKDADN